MHHVGIRELRASAAAIVRRAAAGQETIVSVRGRPVARLAPLDIGGREHTIDDLIATGRLIAPRRTGPPHEATIPVWGNVRLDRLLREVRG